MFSMLDAVELRLFAHLPFPSSDLARHRAGEHLVHARDRNDLEPTLDVVRNFDKILGVLFGNEHCFDAPA